MVTTVPMSTVDVGRSVAVAVTRSDGLAVPLGLKPMNKHVRSSTLQLRLERLDTRDYDAGPDLARLTANLDMDHPRPSGSRIEHDAFPIGAWGEPDLPGVTAPALPTGDVIFAGSQVRLVAQAELVHRGPEIDYYQVEASRRPLPLRGGGTSRATIIGRSTGVGTPAVATADEALSLADEWLFATASSAGVPVGTLPSSPRSALGRASYRGEVAAPPLFGTLADGMLRDYPSDPSASLAVAPPPKAARQLRGPVVAGYLPAGDWLAPRKEPTTVADLAPPRVAAPTVGAVVSRLRHLPTALVTAALPPAVRQETVVAARVPRTGAPGTARSAAHAGLGRAPDFQGRTLGAGDILVLSLPDSSVDVAAARPTLVVSGRARVVMVRGAGDVGYDGPANASLDVPRRTSVVWVQAGAADIDDLDGVAGWHAGSRVNAIGSSVAIAAGCVITTHGPAGRSGVGWMSAGHLLSGSTGTVTRFAAAPRSVAVVVEAPAAQSLASIAVTLRGGRVARDPHGREHAPTVLTSGGQAVLIYPVEAKNGVTVRVRSNEAGSWRLTGVLGSNRDVASLAATIATAGVAGATARLRAAAASGCLVFWSDQSRTAWRQAAPPPPTQNMPRVPAQAKPPVPPVVAPPTLAVPEQREPVQPPAQQRPKKRWWQRGRG